MYTICFAEKHCDTTMLKSSHLEITMLIFVAKMNSQSNSISKQQCVKAELPVLLFHNMVDKSDGDRKTALRD